MIYYDFQRLLADVALQDLLACRNAMHDGCSHTTGTCGNDGILTDGDTDP